MALTIWQTLTGNLTGTANSKFRVVIEVYKEDTDTGCRIQRKYYVQVTQGDFGGPSTFTCSWGASLSGIVKKPGTAYGYTAGAVENYAFGASIPYNASAGYRSSSNTYTSTCSGNLTAPAAPRYTVTFNANGGTGAPGNQTKIHNVNLAISTVKPTRAGYTFQGWSESPTGTTANLAFGPNGGTYTGNRNINLYAVWSLNYHTQTINFYYYQHSGHYGAEVANWVHLGGKSYVLAYGSWFDNASHWADWGGVAGYHYWSRNSEGWTVVGDKNDGDGNHHYYPNRYTLTIDKNGGTGGTDSINMLYGTYVDLVPPTKPGYNFAGWSLTYHNGTYSNWDGNRFVMGYNNSYPYQDYTDAATAIIQAQWTLKAYRFDVFMFMGPPENDDFGDFFDEFIVQSGSTNYSNLTDYFSLPTKRGYLFKGFFDRDGKQVYDENGRFVPGVYFNEQGAWIKNDTIELEICAHWEVEGYNIEYDLKGGTLPLGYDVNYDTFEDEFLVLINPKNTKIPFNGLPAKYDDSFFYVEPPVKSGYIFTGWNITGMDNSMHQYTITEGSHTINYSSSETTLTGIKSTPTYNYIENTTTSFYKLRSSAGTVTFTATWEKIDDRYIQVNNGSKWLKTIPFIYKNNKWIRAIGYVYDGIKWIKIHW